MKLTQRLIGAVLVLVMLVTCLPLLGTEVSAARADGYLTLNEAAQQVKQHLLNRNEDAITVNVYIEDSRALGNNEIEELFDELVFQHTGVPTEGDYLRYATQTLRIIPYVAEHRREGNQHWLTLMFNNHYWQSKANENVVTAKAKEIVTSLNINGKSDYEKILAIYSYICKNVDYELNYEQLTPGTKEHNDIYSAYGALVNNKAVCEGYATAMYRLLLEAGIDNRIEVSDDHAWNIVKLDGKYYYLDSTWDYGYEPENFNWFLVGSADFFDVHHSARGDIVTKEYRQKYPVSPVNYGAPASATGSGSCGDNATWTLTADGTLTISGNGTIRSTVEDQTLWTDVNMYIKKVVIQNGITAIGDYAFWNCPQLASVSIPSSVTSIGNFAFQYCYGLKEITIPNSVTSIGEGAFATCMSLEKVVLPNNLKEIQHVTFYFCLSLKSITIPASVKTIGNKVFSSAFDPNANITFTVPETVTKIGWGAFSHSGLKSVIWNAKTELLDTDAFYMCKNLESVTLNDTIKRLGMEVFSHCYRLKSIKLPSGLTEMEDFFQGIFLNCYALESVTIPKTLTKINDGTFQECISLKEVNLHEGITAIGNNAFSGCGVKNLVIPKSVKTIGGHAFVSPYLESVTFLGDAPQSYSSDRTFGAYGSHTLTVYYQGANKTWTAEVMRVLSTDANVNWAALHDANGPHTLGSTWYSDGTSHWKQCTGCDHKDQVSSHSYSFDCDESCDVCGNLRSVMHTYEWGNNANQHWCACKCGAQLVAPEGHNYNGMGICTGCGATKGNTSNDTVPTTPPQAEPPVTQPPVTEPGTSEPVGSEPSTPVTSEPTTPNVTEPSAPVITDPTTTAPGADVPKEEQTEIPWAIIGIAAVVIIGVVMAIIVIKKKKA